MSPKIAPHPALRLARASLPTASRGEGNNQLGIPSPHETRGRAFRATEDGEMAGRVRVGGSHGLGIREALQALPKCSRIGALGLREA